MKLYVGRPVIIQVIEWTGDNLKEIEEFAKYKCVVVNHSQVVKQLEVLDHNNDLIFGISLGDFLYRNDSQTKLLCLPRKEFKERFMLQEVYKNDLQTYFKSISK